MKIGIMGTGGLGGYIGGRLAYSGQDVTFISRGKQLEALRQSGLKVESHFGDFNLPTVQATDDCSEVGPVDLILFCVKSYDTLAAAEQMKPMVGPQTVVLPVLNGIEHLEILGTLFGAMHVVGGTAVISAHIAAPGHVKQLGPPHRITFGEQDGAISQRCLEIQQLISATGIECELVPNIIEQMWGKLAMISGLFAVFSLARANAGLVNKTPELFDMIVQTMKETMAVAEANGVSLNHSYSVLETLKAEFPKMPQSYEPSMAFALRHGQRLELEAVNGAICRLGDARGVATPLNGMAYACLKPYVNGQTAG